MLKIADKPLGVTLTLGGDPLTVLHLGCGRRKTPADVGMEFKDRDGDLFPDRMKWINLDGCATVEPDILCWLGKDRIDLPDNSVDLVVAMHVIEHIGEIGKTEDWFFFWQELYRVLKPNGRVQFECPYYSSVWAWADPTHVRAISEYTFLYLNQEAYKVGGSIPDYRPQFDFQLMDWQLRPDCNEDVKEREPGSHINGILAARKPLKGYWE